MDVTTTEKSILRGSFGLRDSSERMFKPGDPLKAEKNLLKLSKYMILGGWCRGELGSVHVPVCAQGTVLVWQMVI